MISGRPYDRKFMPRRKCSTCNKIRPGILTLTSWPSHSSNILLGCC